MAGERTSTSAQAMAAGSLPQLRRTAGAGGGSCRQWSGRASRSEFLEVGAIQSRRNPAPDFRRASALAALDRARTAGAVRQRLYHKGGDAPRGAFGAHDRGLVQSRSVHAEYCDRAGGKLPQLLLHGPGEGIARVLYNYPGVLPNGGGKNKGT